MQQSWTKEEEDIIKKYYKTKSKSFLLISLIGKSWPAIQRKAGVLKIKRELGASYANITYFDSWSEKMAYILGFIAADGCIIDRTKSTGDRVLSIAVSIKDYDYLAVLRNELAPNKKIWTYIKIKNGKKYKICYLRIGSKYICDKLISLGITHRKSLTISFPCVPDEYLSHFIRGYFDGDGSIIINRNQLVVNFCSGSKDFLNSLNSIIDSKLDVGIKNVVYGRQAGAYYLNYHTNQGEKVANFMYENIENNIYLKRKFNKFRQLQRT